MHYMVTNIGIGRHFATCLGNVWLARGDVRRITDEKALEELRRYPNLLFEKCIPASCAPLIPPPGMQQATATPDYRQVPINALRRLAALRGLRGASRLSKKSLIEKLEDTYGL